MKKNTKTSTRRSSRIPTAETRLTKSAAVAVTNLRLALKEKKNKIALKHALANEITVKQLAIMPTIDQYSKMENDHERIIERETDIQSKKQQMKQRLQKINEMAEIKAVLTNNFGHEDLFLVSLPDAGHLNATLQSNINNIESENHRLQTLINRLHFLKGIFDEQK